MNTVRFRNQKQFYFLGSNKIISKRIHLKTKIHVICQNATKLEDEMVLILPKLLKSCENERQFADSYDG